MKQLEYELLELENASLKKERDSKREATTNRKDYERRTEEELLLQRLLEDEKEFLRRENLRLNPDYQKRVKEYFEKQGDSTSSGFLENGN
jgi:hypothetical protein